ncbi:NADH-quinone oxidoreductase subunit J [Microbulbifer celer]|uniref:NADH-quinone oxidoreductase subunit J n=1 Tax=Microbulbifer celer TaxID=435905 RepID=A0ABW3U393_9GAMM|nr:NADH-quinone oxidoreductase subunit J [Microbulbifer celer]UFN58026.1 NADH-quinone oxidoreductase subunit J [Microbulbifer celer]
MSEVFFYITAGIALIATGMVIVSRNAVHALLELIVSLLAVAIIFYLLGAAFAAALQVIVYAGAIMVLMVFVIMMLNQGARTTAQEQQWLQGQNWWLPAVLASVLLIQLLYLMWGTDSGQGSKAPVTPKSVGIALFSEYLLAVELASLVLLAGLVGAFHLAAGTGGTFSDAP